jgi:hypothetical protein
MATPPGSTTGTACGHPRRASGITKARHRDRPPQRPLASSTGERDHRGNGIVIDHRHGLRAYSTGEPHHWRNGIMNDNQHGPRAPATSARDHRSTTTTGPARWHPRRANRITGATAS